MSMIPASDLISTTTPLGLNATTVRDLGAGASILHGFAEPIALLLLDGIKAVVRQAPFRHLTMPNGESMAISMTNCGPLGWVSSSGGYRYSPKDPTTGRRWPDMPEGFVELAIQAATAAGFPGFLPSVCIINRYAVGAGLQMHQDRDDTKDGQPVVSVSLGLPAVFRFGARPGHGQIVDVPLQHGDVAVWGGPSRMAYHGILPILQGTHPLTGDVRLNLTFRTARKVRAR